MNKTELLTFVPETMILNYTEIFLIFQFSQKIIFNLYLYTLFL
jgi:hypothetical protein